MDHKTIKKSGSSVCSAKLGRYHHEALRKLGRGDVNKGIRLVLRAYIDNPVAVIGSRFLEYGGVPTEPIDVLLTHDLAEAAHNAGGSVVEGIKIALEVYRGTSASGKPKTARVPPGYHKVNLRLAPEHLGVIDSLMVGMDTSRKEARARAVSEALSRCKSRYGYRRIKIDRQTARNIEVVMDDAHKERARQLGDGQITHGVRRALERIYYNVK